MDLFVSSLYDYPIHPTATHTDTGNTTAREADYDPHHERQFPTRETALSLRGRSSKTRCGGVALHSEVHRRALRADALAADGVLGSLEEGVEVRLELAKRRGGDLLASRHVDTGLVRGVKLLGANAADRHAHTHEARGR